MFKSVLIFTVQIMSVFLEQRKFMLTMVLLRIDLVCMCVILWVSAWYYECVYDILGVFDIMTVCDIVCVCDIMSVCVISWVCVWYHECVCVILQVYVWYSYERCLKQVFPLIKKHSSEKFYFNYFLLIPRNNVDWFSFLFMYLAGQHGMWDLSSQTRDRTWTSCSGSSES